MKLLASQSGSVQVHQRLRHIRRTGRPPAGRSRTWTTLRPRPVAITPQVGQPAMVAVGSTRTHTSPSSSLRESTATSCISSSALASRVRSPMPCALRSRWSSNRKDRGDSGPWWWMPMGGSPVWNRPTPQREDPTSPRAPEPRLPGGAGSVSTLVGGRLLRGLLVAMGWSIGTRRVSWRQQAERGQGRGQGRGAEGVSGRVSRCWLSGSWRRHVCSPHVAVPLGRRARGGRVV